MSKTMTLRTMALLIMLTLGWQAGNAQAFWTETFSDQTTSETNWVHGGTNGGAEVWKWTNVIDAGNFVPGNFGSPTAADGYMWFDSDVNGNFQHDVTLTGVGNPADCTGKTDVHLRFYTLFRIFGSTYEGQVGVSTDGTNFTYFSPAEFMGLDGSSAATDRFEGWVDLDVDMADGQPQVWVQFRWIGEFEYYWKVDDVEMYEYVTPEYDVTFNVNMALETVDPAGVFFASSLTGGVPEAMSDMGNGIWSITKTVLEGEEVTYAYANGGSPESVPMECGTDVGGIFARTYTATSDKDLNPVCFGECDDCVIPCDLNPMAIICDNFDTYNTGALGPQAAHWTTWSGNLGGAEDGIVSTTQANTAPNSMYIVSGGAGGPQDVVLDLGNQTTGRYELKWKMYMPDGKQGYYNIQDVVPIGAGSWNLDVFFGANGMGNCQIGAGPVLAEFSYNNAEWIDVVHEIDLDNNLLTLWIGGEYVIKMAYPNNLGGIDYYPIDGNHEYYVDDLEYVQLPAVVYDADFCNSAVDLSQYFGQANGVAQTTELYDNSSATVDGTDNAGSCWGENNVDNSMWYTFTGDGGMYHIETVPCTATNYIGTAQDLEGDTQIAIYTGEECDDLTEIYCAEDLFATGDPDWRAGLDIETEAGVDYYMLVDGFNAAGTIAVGEFCVEITQLASIGCADAVVGNHTLDNNGFLCFGDNLNQISMPDVGSFVIPNNGPVAGMCWTITTDPVPSNMWPGDIAGVASTVFNPEVIITSLPNDGTAFPAGTYYLTPVVVGGADLIDPAGLARIFNVDPTNGCYFVGESLPVTLLPELDDLFALSSVTDETPPGNNGAIELAVSGGIAEVLGDPSLYLFNWSNGEATQDISGLTGGMYTVTISDPTGCVADFTLSITVGTSVSTTDPASVKSLVIAPNPTSSDAFVRLDLENSEDVRLELTNTLGQIVRTHNAGNVQNLNYQLNMVDMPAGTYLLRVTIGNESAVRRVVVQR